MLTKWVLYDLFTDPLSYLSITDCQSMESLGLQVHVRVSQLFYVWDKVQVIIPYFYYSQSVFFLQVHIIQFLNGV